jgi:hypothetical protein
MLTDAVSCGLLSLNPILEHQRKAHSQHRPETVDPARPFTEDEKARVQDAIRRLRRIGWRLRPSDAVHSVTRLRNSRPATLSRSSKSQENRTARMWEKTARGGSGWIRVFWEQSGSNLRSPVIRIDARLNTREPGTEDTRGLVLGPAHTTERGSSMMTRRPRGQHTASGLIVSTGCVADRTARESETYRQSNGNIALMLG